jgi:putative peptidoglycan lipid II flippase
MPFLLKIINSEAKTIVGAAAIIGVLSFVSRIVGLIRDRVFAGAFGAGDVLDAYYAAFKLPDFIFSLIVVGGLSASFIPIFTQHYRAATPRAWRLTNNTLHIVIYGMLGLSAVLFVFAGPVAKLIAPGFPLYKQAMVVDFMRVMLLAQVILAASVVLGSALQGMRRFYLYALAPILYNFGIILGAVVFVRWFGSIGLPIGVVFGAALHFLVQLYGVVAGGYRYQCCADWHDPETRQIIRLAGPRMLGIAVSQVNAVIFTVIASTLVAGSVTIFQFAYNIQFFPVGIVGVAYAVAAFPAFSEHLAAGDKKKFLEVFSSTVRQCLFFMVPLMLLFLIVRAQIVRVVVGAGAFDWAATIATADTLAFLAMSFIPQVLVFILARAFFALKDTTTPLVGGLVSALLGLIGALLLSEKFGVVGLGMIFTISSFVNALLLWAPLRQRIGSLDEAKIAQSFLKMAGAALPAAVVMQLLKPVAVRLISLDTFLGVFSQGLLSGGAGLLVYFGLSYLFRSEELLEAISGLKRRVLKTSKPSEPVQGETAGAS